MFSSHLWVFISSSNAINMSINIMTILTFVVCSLFNVFPVDRGNKKQIRFVPALSITIFFVNDKVCLCLNHQWTWNSVSPALYVLHCKKALSKHINIIKCDTKMYSYSCTVCCMLYAYTIVGRQLIQHKNILELWIRNKPLQRKTHKTIPTNWMKKFIFKN